METVFISYSHDSEEHKKRVLALANRLRREGVDCVLDQYETSPAQGWPKWMDRQLKEAKYVIIICTETYLKRVEDENTPGTGKGVKWESTLTYQYIYDDDSRNTRFIPVVFEPGDCKYIPTPLKGASYYCVNTQQGYDSLYRRLTDQPQVEIPGIGEKRVLPPERAAEDFLFTAGDHTPEVSLYKLPITGDRLFGREEELKLLDAAWHDAHTRIVTLVAWAGVGKTALVNRWLNEMQGQGYLGAHRVYGWSFYSQGAAEGKQASADEFFQETLHWFCDPQPGAGSPVDRGRRLARLVGQDKTLLILDGLEPLQYPPGALHGLEGKLKDPGLAAFLKELAVGHPAQPGLCVITTQESVTDLEPRKGYAVKEILLDHLSEEAGQELLKSLGVKLGMTRDIKAAVREYDGHALALTLLGNYIQRVYQGDIRKRDEIPQLSKERVQGRHAGRVMAAYEEWFGPCPERDILYILGLFDRPVGKGAIEALKGEPVIPGVTDRLQQMSAEDYGWALSHVREARLLAAENPQKPGMLDCHPLVREYFGERLRQENPAGWQAAHERLFRYYQDLPAKELPDTLEEMDPLFAAVAHGCTAGLHREALYEVWYNRIKRGKDHYSTDKLGAFGADLACLSHFFYVPWAQPAAGLSEQDKALVLSCAAFDLRALGRLLEAVQPMRAGLENYIQQKDLKGAAVDANNLSELMLTLGDVPAAVAYARQSVGYADRSRDWGKQMINRTALADALLQSGRLKEAEQLFRQAEDMQKKRQPEYPFLYSFQGYRFCDLLLAQGRYAEVRERAEKALEIVLDGSRNLLDIALNKLSLGRARLLSALKGAPSSGTSPGSGPLSRAMTFLTEAVEGLREAGTQDHLPRGLLARAEAYRHLGDHARARHDLEEALDIAGSGSMKLFICDYHLEAGRLCQAQGKAKQAANYFHQAKSLIAETGYHRRKDELP